jgi:4-coumarate--CoA ligase
VTVNTELKILLDDGTLGGIDEIGEILVRKRSRFLGYFKNAHLSIVDDDGFIRTGDMGFINVNFEVHIIGQKPFIIKNFYHEVYPSELEEILSKLDGIKGVCVVGVPDTSIETGAVFEVPAALVVRDETCDTLITEDYVKLATSHLPRFKRIRDVFFVQNFALSSSGKFRRNLIKEMAEQLKISRIQQRSL